MTHHHLGYWLAFILVPVAIGLGTHFYSRRLQRQPMTVRNGFKFGAHAATAAVFGVMGLAEDIVGKDAYVKYVQSNWTPAKWGIPVDLLAIAGFFALFTYVWRRTRAPQPQSERDDEDSTFSWGAGADGRGVTITLVRDDKKVQVTVEPSVARKIALMISESADRADKEPMTVPRKTSWQKLDTLSFEEAKPETKKRRR